MAASSSSFSQHESDECNTNTEYRESTDVDTPPVLQLPSDGKSMRFLDICRLRDLDIVSLVSVLVVWGVLHDFSGPCDKYRPNLGRTCGGTVKLETVGSRPQTRYRCSACKKSTPLFFNSFFSKSKANLVDLVGIIYMFVRGYSYTCIQYELGVGTHTVVDWLNYCRDICSIMVNSQTGQLGGEGIIVEIDESKFGKRKYNRGRAVEGAWVFGAVEHLGTDKERKTGRCRLHIVTDRTKITLLDYIKKWVRPGSTIHSDCFSSYKCLEGEGFVHRTVNHKETYSKFDVEANVNVHTNSIEGLWKLVKQGVPCEGRSRKLLQSHLDAFCYRRDLFNTPSDPFLNFLSAIASIYRKDGVAMPEEEDRSGDADNDEVWVFDDDPPEVEVEVPLVQGISL